MLLEGKNIEKEYGIQNVLKIGKIEIYEGDRIGLVGRNGAGKSTLLKILCGKIKADEGQIKCGCEIAYIDQDSKWEEIDLPEEVQISKMGIRDSEIKSGGEKTRFAIASAFSKHAPLLFADEPTTNLDVDGINTLEKMLIGYGGAVVLVSHDRQLLDNVCTQIWEIKDGDVCAFPGNYSDWFLERKREREYKKFEYDKYRSEKKRLEKIVGDIRNDASTMKKPPSRMGISEWMLYKGTASIQQNHVQKRGKAVMSRLEHLEEKEKPEELPSVSMKLGEPKRIKAPNAARFKKFTFSYGENIIIKDADLDISSGKKIFLTGKNGCGKSTMINGLINKMEGTFISTETKIGYFSQNHNVLDWNKTILENVKETAVVPEHICRAVLCNLFIQKNDLEKKVKVISGGERVKTALAKVLVSGCNFLILDEPTNHMDVYTMEGLERLLKDYDGTLLAVSHDRKFVENLADEIYILKDGKISKEENI